MKRVLLGMGLMLTALTVGAEGMGHPPMDMRGMHMMPPLPSFLSMDRNRDGCVASDEYARMETDDRPLPDFDAVDTDEDGCSTLQEVRQYRRKAREQGPPPA